MNAAYRLPTLAVVALAGCASVYVPPAQGPVTALTVSTTTLQRRSGLAVDEFVNVFIQDASGRSRGLLKLTLEKNSLTTQIPASEKTTLRFEKVVPLPGTLISCTGQVELTAKENEPLVAKFEFFFNLSTGEQSECTVDVDRAGQIERFVLQRKRTRFEVQFTR